MISYFKSRRFRSKFVYLLCVGLLVFLPSQSPAESSEPPSLSFLPSLESGYREMYNLDFATAHQTFHAWELSHPNDPMGPASNATAYLFAEFKRLHILESELFTDNERFEKREKPVPDAAAKSAFEDELANADRLASTILSRSPQDTNAAFAKILANGLHGDYLALIEKRNIAGLGYMKTARSLAEKLIAADPTCYDAYLAVGIENYLLGVTPAPVRWILRLSGAQTNKDEGIAKLRLTAEKGRYLAPFARMLLAVVALRDKDRATARTLLASLSHEFPQNGLYQKELARIQP
jgi:hypothetical protein